jgi:hypothetical protein
MVTFSLGKRPGIRPHPLSFVLGEIAVPGKARAHRIDVVVIVPRHQPNR